MDPNKNIGSKFSIIVGNRIETRIFAQFPQYYHETISFLEGLLVCITEKLNTSVRATITCMHR